MRAKIATWIVLGLLVIGAIAFFLGPKLFASIAFPLFFQDSVAKWSKHYNVDANMIEALIMIESGGNPSARSCCARGATQFTDGTAIAVAQRLGISPFTPEDLVEDPDMAVQFAAYYMGEHIKNYDGDVFKALQAYNGGHGAVMSNNSATVVYAQNVLSRQQLYYEIYGRWWDVPDLNIKPRDNNSATVGQFPILGFWKNLLFTRDIPRSSEQGNGDGSFGDFWQNLLPGY
ncbi:hypothetical protein A3A71_03550 [Candidatus Berkelbacteria bacterium RIFCSPLOWO2_01_FULL_50_28]|uniref:Transglycosylase SLT domain-containing protein n=1 Tax=Candidatus Berkelbacteria bacterium RIFCSPLOWO2_01_FULL_50_28 TaxID=1797471 RepID=A0A1F5ECW0_9BACT|nr:MAG: hypothetical protein A2807_03115 [Candidatus Berkelbacteria bacterium RIFCSPHIGHO2_01_FULL_50_36]OGD63653.1 MAG: hypothetical protein A3F39_04330 [Candidatus Berkelbacteria bacterium RIFCSPHIGHO2_12_FULL_50_11]OGD65130.1 MAG: hypothetical protein A3A71_03550 [Candidatus Berkelbacteria bacterium RIFCSPLOWO2_01_FULL_50_28]